MRVCAFVFCCWILAIEPCLADLIAGDLAVIGISGDDDDSFIVVAMTDIAAGEAVFITDNDWTSATGPLDTTEGTLTWTNGLSTLSAGTFIVFDGPSGIWSASVGTVSETATFALGVGGDEVIIYEGTAVGSPTTFVYALSSASTSFDTTGTPGADGTYLPTGLVDGTTANAFGAGATPDAEFDNIRYTGPTSGSRAFLLGELGKDANWEGSDTRFAAGSGGGLTAGLGGASSFTITPVPEPSSMALIACAGLVAAVRRRRVR